MKLSIVFLLTGLLQASAVVDSPDQPVVNIPAERSPEAKVTQTISVTGKVTNEAGEPLVGAYVYVKDQDRRTSTDEGGNYKINVSGENSVLVFSYVGFEVMEIKVGDRKTIDAKLAAPSQHLEEVVVVGYGTELRKDLTGSVSTVNMDDLAKAPVGSFDQALAGRIAGVQVSSSDGQPGMEMNIVIRGANSLTQSNSPLYVIDGFPVEDPENAAINPEEIESINVLKDASATAIYGSRGANGVIIIETKKGQEGKPVVSLNSSVGYQQVQKQMEMMDAYEFVRYQLELSQLTARRLYTPADLDPSDPAYDEEGRTLEDYRNIQGTDWQSLIYRNSPMNIHNMAVRGGTAGTRYSLSGSVFDNEGIVINTGAKRYQGRITLDQTISKKLKVGVTVNYSNNATYGQRVNEGGGGHFSSYLLYRAWAYRPVAGNPDIDLIELDDDPDNADRNILRINPLTSSNNEYDHSNTSSFQSNVYLDYNILKNLRLRIRGAINNTRLRRDRFFNSRTPRGSPLNINNNMGVHGDIGYRDRSNWANENILTYNTSFKRHHRVVLTGGLSFQEDRVESFGFTSQRLINEALGIYGFDEGIPYSNAATGSESGLVSLFARANYNFRSKYLFTATMRADGSSKFNPANRWGYFPSAAFAWNMNREEFMKDLSWLSNSKIRLSYGVTGNNRVSDYPTYDRYSQSIFYSFDNGTPILGVVPSEVGNEHLKWESTAQFDVGYDLGLFKDRIQFTFDYYKKTTRDLLLYADMPTNTGFSRAYKNIGALQNTGLEFTLNTVNVQSKIFSWESSFNISFNRNKILELTNNQESMFNTMNISQVISNLYVSKIGYPAGMFYGYVFDGIYQEEDFNSPSPGVYILKNEVPNNGNARNLIEPGHIRYRDINGDNIVDANDMVMMGSALPIHTGGFSNNFGYKDFSLNVFFQWSYGNKIFNANRMVFEGNSRGSLHTNQYATYSDRWTLENRSNELFKVGGAGPDGAPSTRMLEDGSYLRFKTVSLRYSIPQRLIKPLYLSSLNVHASAQNLLTFTNYTGMDPETSVRHTVLTPGYDYSPYPQPRTITFGVNATF